MATRRGPKKPTEETPQAAPAAAAATMGGLSQAESAITSLLTTVFAAQGMTYIEMQNALATHGIDAAVVASGLMAKGLVQQTPEGRMKASPPAAPAPTPPAPQAPQAFAPPPAASNVNPGTVLDDAAEEPAYTAGEARIIELLEDQNALLSELIALQASGGKTTSPPALPPMPPPASVPMAAPQQAFGGPPPQGFPQQPQQGFPQQGGFPQQPQQGFPQQGGFPTNGGPQGAPGGWAPPGPWGPPPGT